MQAQRKLKGLSTHLRKAAVLHAKVGLCDVFRLSVLVVLFPFDYMRVLRAHHILDRA